jgi:hypothetical protein
MWTKYGDILQDAKVSKRNVLLTLNQLKTNSTFDAMVPLWGVSRSQIYEIWETTINTLNDVLEEVRKVLVSQTNANQRR